MNSERHLLFIIIINQHNVTWLLLSDITLSMLFYLKS